MRRDIEHLFRNMRNVLNGKEALYPIYYTRDFDDDMAVH